MRIKFGFCLAAIILLGLNPIANAQTAPATQPARTIWNSGGGGFFRRQPVNPDAKILPRIKVDGNHFVTSDGQVILFRGVSIADPDKIDGEGHWNKELFEHIANDMGANLIRIPVHPAAWRERTPQKYLLLLDQAVHWCTQLNMHVIIDWHSIGNLHMEVFQSAIYDTTQKETYDFWRTIARHFNGHNTVAFEELFNEPSTSGGQFGSATWSQWKELNENMIHLIRAYDKQVIPLVAGFDWAYDLTPIREQPIDAEGIGYVTHPYANKRQRPWEPKWEEDYGFAASKYPMIATEIGFNLRPGDTINDDHYGNRITRYLEGRGISWMAWCYDPQWGPTILRSWNYDLTAGGEFFKMAMHRPIATAN